jgi:hypothetical protein
VLLLRPGSFLLQDPDSFWHIYTGQWILAHRQFPTIDFWSYTAAGKPWISTEWLSQVALAVAYRLGGWHGVVILTAIVCAAIFGILCFYLVQNLRFSVAIGWTALTALAISPHLLARPHIFSYVLMEIWIVYLLNSYDAENFKLRSLMTLAPLMVLWANTHGSFTFGLVLLYVFVGACLFQNLLKREYIKNFHLLIILIVVSLCAFLTPYGFVPALMSKELLNLKFTMSGITELRSPDFQAYTIQLILFVALFLAIFGFGIKLHGARLIAFIIITGLALSYTRGLIMFFIIAPFILARPVRASARYFAQLSKTQPSEHEPDPVLQYLQGRSTGLPTVCVVIAVLVITLSTWWRRDAVPPDSIAPDAALAFVKKEKITGNVFNDYDFGGYLIFSGIPTFVDGRALPFGDDFLRKYFNAVILSDLENSFKLLDDYKVSWIILNPTRPLSRALAQDANWRQVYSDKFSIVFVRR